MQSTIRLAACLVVTSFAFAVASVRADHEKSKQASANEIIGMKVTNAQNEDLGKVQDLIVNVDSGNVPYAVISSGLLGQRKVAVPLEALQCSGDGKHFTLAATKEELKMASKSPQGQWGITENAEWTKTVDGYYGRPAPTAVHGRPARTTDDARVYNRDPAPKGAERLVQPADRALCEKICSAIDNVQVDVDNGVAHLYGTVESETARQSVEAKVRSVAGVQRVESHLKVR
jgi:sporulation protein YlmC with PRC-barrel domain